MSADEHTTAATNAPVDYLEVARTAMRVADAAKYTDTRHAFAESATAAALIALATRLGELVDLVRQAWEDERTPASPVVERICRSCGCTDAQACEGGCSWATDDLCSRCEQRAQDAGSDPLGERGYVQ